MGPPTAKPTPAPPSLPQIESFMRLVLAAVSAEENGPENPARRQVKR
jgi:hypothetical protein